jgi:hypothetical protein
MSADLVDDVGRKVEGLVFRETGAASEPLEGAQTLPHDFLHDVGVAPARASGSHPNLTKKPLIKGKGGFDPCHKAILP